MADPRPMGVFDRVGGLTVLSEVRRRALHESRVQAVGLGAVAQ